MVVKDLVPAYDGVMFHAKMKLTMLHWMICIIVNQYFLHSSSVEYILIERSVQSVDS